ncbi:hypothetical protein [Oscillatoria acuminata]|uniref:Uncharacterized protein n=1 Tax=Oscillatoria acuminata PCC 6304 TaxID=56110 RepID=K9TB93_9CYAN|nr:hypothetical protein [Oscillatoria acuminata]AFY80172.1 hypothetical protein Oscil6304_0423 [Oscillatoria acuminata PCC 6304]
MAEQTGAFDFEFRTGEGETITEIFNTTPLHEQYTALSTRYDVFQSFYLEQFKFTISIESLAQAEIPALAADDTETEKAIKIRNIERKYPKLGLEIYQAHNGGPWRRQALAILQNRGSEYYLPAIAPYLAVGEVDVMGPATRLGLKFIAMLTNGVFYGPLGENDYVIIKGAWRQVVDLIPKLTEITEVVSNFGVLIDSSSTPVRGPNLTRKLIWVRNAGSRRVWISFGEVAAIDRGSYLNPGDTLNYEATRYRLTQGINAIAVPPEPGESEGPILLTGMEAS